MAIPSVASTTNGRTHESIRSDIIISARTTATATYIGACVSQISFVSSTIAVRPLIKVLSLISPLICFIVFSVSSDEPAYLY